jgi:hypothetical protein
VILDNVAEVLNVVATAFNVPGTSHVRLAELFGPGELLPADVSTLSDSSAVRLDLTLDVAGYGEARLSVVSIV